jgi:acyl carrier protein
VSVAAHSDDAVRQAIAGGADAVLVSPVFASRPPGNVASGKEGRGLGALRSARALAGGRIAVYALGGVDPQNAGACATSGADGVAVVRALLGSPDPGRVARAIHGALSIVGDARPACYRCWTMASYEESLRITCELLRRHVAGARAIRPSDHIQNDLGLDSLGVMELVADVETRFGVSIPREMFDKIATVDDVARAVTTLQP